LIFYRVLQVLRTLGEGDDRGGGTGTLRVLENLGGTSLVDGDTRVGGAEVDTDDGAGDLRVVALGANEGGGGPLRVLAKSGLRSAVAALEELSESLIVVLVVSRCPSLFFLFSSM
jgi:hypothetical protein